MRTHARVAAILWATMAVGVEAGSPTPVPPANAERGTKGRTMAQETGTFEVKVQPLPADEKVPGLKVGRYAVDKQWKGQFEGTSKGEMMTAEVAVPGSGGYAAVEQLTGTLDGRAGSFTVVHRGTMQANASF